jgi:methylthioribose-1-phosphate isomerase
MQDTIRPIRWRNGRLGLLDQRRLPAEEVWLEYVDSDAAAGAIRDMVVRGAPAIGVTAGFATVLAARAAWAPGGGGQAAFEAALDRLNRARPTAVNLMWAVARMRALAAPLAGDPTATLEAEAVRMHDEDIAANRRMGEHGAALIVPGGAVITHCNTGSLATAGFGTALGVIRTAWAQQRINGVFADETRPWLQGARLTAWELVRDGIPVTLMAEGAAAHRMRQGGISWAIVGADRIAANGDTANKIGTYHLAIAARHHGVKFMVAAPTSTIDAALADGGGIPIEQRGADEVLSLAGRRIAPEGAQAWNPAFDVTPAALIDAVVTEKGVASPVTRDNIARLLAA